MGASSDRLLVRSTFEFHKSVFLLFEKYNRPGLFFFRPMVFLLLYFRFLILIFYQTQRKLSGIVRTLSLPQKTALKTVAPEKIKVLRIISRMNIGGPAIHVKLLHEGLNRNRFDTKLVTGNARKIKKRKLAQITADVGTADAHPVGAYQGLAGAGIGGLVDIDPFEGLRFGNLNGTHLVYFARE